MVESELDAMLIHHACGGKIGALAILTASGKPDAAAHAALSAAARILMVMDWDAKPNRPRTGAGGARRLKPSYGLYHEGPGRPPGVDIRG
ncbi:MAG: hypothetical protein ACLR7Z_04475 [Bilophila wadsworthia]